ncbi:MAG TPA: DUF2807 domain-containing protein [Saprospiraceae bacterium]|nr:DUF2807 domain-containing protein [Saprospiraceae bacterium]HMQ82471.1 DUF2807 domain-containing protein [Saprospiraceae bacterium]
MDGKNAIGDAIKRGIAAVGKVVAIVIGLIVKIWKPLLIIVGMALVIALAVSWISTVVGLSLAWPFIEYFSPDQPYLSLLGSINLLFVIGLPLLSLVLTITRLLFGTRMRTGWKAALSAFWFINLVSLSFVGTRLFMGFQQGATVTQNIDLSSIQGDTLDIQMVESPYSDSWVNFGGELQLADQSLIAKQVQLSIVKAEGNVFELVEELSSRGNTLGEAERQAAGIAYEAQVLDNNRLSLPSFFHIYKGDKWRGQRINLTLKVPVGKAIRMGDHYPLRINHIELADEPINPWEERGKTWVMTNDGLSCQSCERESSEQDMLEFDAFSQLKLEGKMKVSITQGDSYKVKLTGNPAHIRTVDATQDGEVLRISTPLRNPSSPLRLNITMPQIHDLDSRLTDDIYVGGFDMPTFHVTTFGAYEVKIDVKADSLFLEQDNHSKVDLRGQCNWLKAALNDRTRLDGEKMTIGGAEVTATENSRAFFGNLSKLDSHQDESSSVTSKE